MRVWPLLVTLVAAKTLVRKEARAIAAEGAVEPASFEDSTGYSGCSHAGGEVRANWWASLDHNHNWATTGSNGLITGFKINSPCCLHRLEEGINRVPHNGRERMGEESSSTRTCVTPHIRGTQIVDLCGSVV